MNYYKYFSDDKNAIKLIDVANAALNLYLKGKKKESYESSKSFYKFLGLYKFNTFPVSEKTFCKTMGRGAEMKYKEYNNAKVRFDTIKDDEVVDDFVYDHNINTIDCMLYEIGAIEKSQRCPKLIDYRYNYLNSNKLFFNREDEYKYGDEVASFIRNAYRAEMYSKENTFFGIDNPFHDMYTPLILTRMGVEQFIKTMYTRNIGQYGEYDTASSLNDELAKKKVYSEAMRNELRLVLQRGNVNTHTGEANYSFGIIHGIEVLKKCFKILIK